MRRDQVLRAAAVGLVLYGLLGFALLVLGLSIVWQTFAGIDQLRGSLVGQRDGLVGALRATSATLGSASTGFQNVDRTLTDAGRSSARAAELASEMSQTMAGLASAAGVQVLGMKPFGELGEGFGRASGQMRELGGDLRQTSESLGQNGEDMRAIRANLGEVRAQVDEVARAFETTPLLGGTGGELPLYKLALYGLLLWLAGQALVSVLLGVVLFDRTHRRLRAARAERALPESAAESRLAMTAGPERRADDA